MEKNSSQVFSNSLETSFFAEPDFAEPDFAEVEHFQNENNCSQTDTTFSLIT